MNRTIAVAAGALAGWLAFAAPAHAHGRVQWSVTIGSPGYVVVPQGVVVSPQPRYIYGPPPSAFAPPPNVIYVPAYPVYPVYPPPVTYVDPYGRPIYPRHEHRRHKRDDWDDHHRRWDYRR